MTEPVTAPLPTFVGVNLPWHVYGCDFGANAWFRDGGVGRPEPRRRLDDLFAHLSAAGLRVVRWFLFCDGRAGIRFDDHGMPLGLDEYCFRDIDAALAIAASHRASLLFALFDFTWFRPRRMVNGVQVFGRRAAIARADRRRALLERVVEPVLTRYGREPVVAAWDLVNEPEWATWGFGARLPWRAVRPATMRAWLEETARLAHTASTRPVTVGLASRGGLPLVEGLGLDFYQVHWYDRLERRSPLAHPASDLDRPLVLGEFPTSGSKLTAAEVVAAAREAGYAGALAWSARAGDEYSSLSALERALGVGPPSVPG